MQDAQETAASCPLPQPGQAGTVTAYYNGACPVCRAEMTAYRRIAEEKGLAIAFSDAAQDAAPAAALGLTPDRALRRLHAVDAEGKLHVGFDAMLLVWRQVPRTRWMGWLFGLPLVRPVAGWLYEHVVSWSLYHWARRRMARAEQTTAR